MKLNGKPGEDVFATITANVDQFKIEIERAALSVEKLAQAMRECAPKIQPLRYKELVQFVSNQNTLLPRAEVERIAAALFQEMNQQIDKQFIDPPKPKAVPKVRRAIALNGVPRG